MCGPSIKALKRWSICDLAVEGVNSGSKIERENFSEKQNKTWQPYL